MGRHLRCVWLLAVALIAVAGDSAFADVALEYRWSPGGGVSRASVSLTPGRLRVDIQAGARSISLLFDGAARRLWVVDHARRSYVEVGDDDLRQIRQVRERMEVQLSQLPPGAREQMERMMTPPGFSRVETAPRDLCEAPRVVGTETVQGVPARIVEGCRSLAGARWVSCRFWVAEGRAVGLGPEEFRVMAGFADFFLDLVRTVGLPAALEGGDLLVHPRPERFGELGVDFPVVVKAARIEDGRQTATMILDRFSRDPLPDAVFTVPQGYERITLSLPR
ncbi:MAG: hypothetical protein QN210_03120 [Armatimonadota bacterium]|nr:hypothetical protein [Armatimonadota bacterium]MDR7517577.1 hypothetical protein [Armatimonadota bacterium]MDR7561520.1 hypothetical protein [Armatimonadota bacterium]MDR7582182.1 hypothetical protein [Armatimonadota bacterium]MDR7587778.1 hypothetical protein [Armatimonadota bacterium]